MARILFVAYGGAHVKMVVPLVRALRLEGRHELQVLGLTTAGPVLEAEGIPYIGFKDLVESGDEAALAVGRSLLEKTVPVKVPSEESVAYLGLSYTDLERREGVAQAAKLYAEKGRQNLLPLSILERLFRRFKPDLVVATNSPRCEKAAILTARKLGIPALCLVDMFCMPEVAYVGQPGYADKVCVFSEFTRQIIVKAGRREDEIVVTGNPAFDRLASPDLAAEGLRLRAEKGWLRKKVILWASQPEPAPNGALPRQVDAALIAALSGHPDWQLVIRPHPSEALKFDALPENVSVSTQSDELARLLAASDVVVTFNSAVGLEGFLMGKPLVTVDLSVNIYACPYSEMGISIGVTRLEALEGALAEALGSGVKTVSTIPRPGGATGRVLEVLGSLIDG